MTRRGLSAEQRFWLKVKKTDTCWTWTAATTTKGYGRFDVEGRDTAAHRLSYEMSVGPIPEGMMLDHTCHNRACVNPNHLRAVTNKQNAENRIGAHSNSRTGVRGVHWEGRYRKYVAAISHNYKRIYVGSFQSLTDAEAAVVAKRLELFTHNDIDRKVSA